MRGYGRSSNARFGQDFSDVRIHTDGRAAASAKAVDAVAYTVEGNVVFGASAYDPVGSAGRRLLAHELAHVIQQRDGGGLALRRQISEAHIPPDVGVLGWVPAKKAKFWINAFIPDTVAGAAKVTSGSYKGKTMFTGPFPWSDCFLSDSRGFSNDIKASSRLHLEAEVDLTSWPTSWMSPAPTSSGTAELDCESMDIECEKVAQPTKKEAPAPLSSLGFHLIPFSFSAYASDPCVRGAPDLNFNGTVEIDTLHGRVSFYGNIQPFPAVEAYVSVDGAIPQELFAHAISPGASVWSLYGAAKVGVSGSVPL